VASTIRVAMKNALHDAEVKFKSTWTSTNELSNAIGLWREALRPQSAELNAISVVPMPTEWADVEYRQPAMEANVAHMIASQVRINREERGLTQAQLGSAMGTKQSAISRLEDPEGGDVLVSTLVKAAHAFDCALLVRFVDYSQFAAMTHDVRPERLYAVPFQGVASSASLAIDHGNT
jgi:transcriptional regulator with XRE-family HTH domain